ncbi:MAG: hypothetical protein GX879_03020 [Bacteroidales bacterium]|nr:hypothetical protein [Bacteroidales bacterium]
MKRMFLISAIILAVLAFSSCEKKSGVYTPKKKISRVYEQWTGGNKMLSEKWTWDGNLLSKIEEYWDGELYGTYRYKYDGKQVSEIIEVDGYTAKFKYDGKKLNKIEVSYNNFILMTFTPKYTKNNITEIEVVENDVDYNYTKVGKLLRGVLPENTFKHDAVSNKSTRGTMSSETYTMKFTYESSNIKKKEIIYQDGYTETFVYTYDKGKNPYNGLLISPTNLFELSKNNVIKEVIEDSEGYYKEYEYDYTYENNYPTEITYQNGGYTYTSFITYE